MMKSWSIKWRVLVLALLPPAIIAVLLAVHFTDSRLRDVEAQLRERGQAIIRQLAPASEYGLFVRNPEILQALADSVKKEMDVMLVMLSDVPGEVVAMSGDPKARRGKQEKPDGVAIGVTDYGDALQFTAPVYQSETRLEEFPDEAGLRLNGRKPKKISILGWVTVTMSKASMLNRRDELLRNSLLISLLVMAGATLLALRMGLAITRPLQRLVEAVEAIGRGNLDVHVDSAAGGEIQTLAQGINSMAASLRSAQENLQEKIDLATQQLSYQATHDTLTGLINRREFEVRVERALQSSHENGATHALCFLDLDQFKIVNDTCGHEAGDNLLRQLAYHLKNKLRDRDTLARVGGDEFSLLLENCSLDNAVDVARSLLDSINGFRFSWQGKSFVVGGSIGLAVINRKSESVSLILSQADSACYTAKDLGRNRVYVFQGPEDGSDMRPAGTSWVTRINQALEEHRFRLHYQPIVPLHSDHPDRPRYFEVLLRMEQNNGDMVLPMAFLPAAERYNLMQTLDRWVVEAAFADYRRLLEAGVSMQDCIFSINLSGPSLGDEKFPKFLEYKFASYQVPPHRICFEITETAAITNLTQALGLIQQQKRIGCRFMLDDFGSGLSSFTYLKNLPVDGIKIDGAFVKDMVANSMDCAMVEAINNIGHAMGLITVAEYVEDQAILQRLREIKVDYVQGHGVQPPGPLEDCFNFAQPAQFRLKV
jgi:diguanylate cyclase (GGDEF)-like protein